MKRIALVNRLRAALAHLDAAADEIEAAIRQGERRRDRERQRPRRRRSKQ
jgi:hypothetical protein